MRFTIDDDSQRPHACALSEDSLTWRHFGDLRSGLLILRTSSLQAMHPVISQALIDHSEVFANPWNRLLRSATPILQTVYGSESSQHIGHSIRDWHRPIFGRLADGRRYHALDPQTYFWAHAVFFESQIATAEFFGDPLTEHQKQTLYAESIDWYRLYGVSMRPVPADYPAFRRYWDETIAGLLAPTEPVLWTFSHAQEWPAPYGWIPDVIWRVAGRVLTGLLVWIARGTLPPQARERLGLRWSRTDQKLLSLLGACLRIFWRVLPPQFRLAPNARRAVRRARQTRRLQPAAS